MLGNNASRRYETRKANCLADHREATRNVEVGTKEHKNISSIDRRTLEDASIQKAAISGLGGGKWKPKAKQGVPETVKDGKCTNRPSEVSKTTRGDKQSQQDTESDRLDGGQARPARSI